MIIFFNKLAVDDKNYRYLFFKEGIRTSAVGYVIFNDGSASWLPNRLKYLKAA